MARLARYPSGLEIDEGIALELQTSEPSGVKFSDGVTYATRIKAGGTYGMLWLESGGLHYNVAGTDVTIPTVAADSVPNLDNGYNAGHDITVDAGAISLADSSSGATNTLTLSKSATNTGNAIGIDLDAAVGGRALYVDAGNGARTAALTKFKLDGTFSSGPGGTLMDIDITQTGAAASALFDIDVGSIYTGDILNIALGAAATTGYVINYDMNLGVAYGFMNIDCGGGAQTADIIDVKFDGSGNVSLFDIDHSNTGTGNLFDIDVSGIGSGDVINITYSAASTGDAIVLDMTSAVGGSALVLVGSGARTDDLIKIDDDSTSNSPVFDINMSGNSTGGIFSIACNTSTVAGDIFSVDMDTNLAGSFLDIDCGAKTRTANLFDIKHDGDGNVSVLDIASTNDGTADIIVLDINSTGSGSAIGITYATSANTGDAIDIVMDTNVGGSALTISAAGDRTDDLIKIDDSSTGNTPVFDINITGIYESNIFDIFIDDACTGAAVFNTDLDGGLAMRYEYIDAGAGTRTAFIRQCKFDGDGNVGYLDLDCTNTGSGHLFDIDITGDAHTGNAIDITYGTAAGTGNAIALNMGTNVAGMALDINSSATGVDGEGAAIDIVHDGNLAAGADLVRITDSGNASSTSNLLFIEGSGTATAGAYALKIAAADSMEALHVDSGTVLFDETLTVTGATTLTGAATATAGIQSAAVARTAGDGTGTAVIAAGTKFVDVTSDDANKFVVLPLPVLGNIIYIQESSGVGFEVRCQAVTQHINGTVCTGDKELACANECGTVVFTCTVAGAAGKWTQFFIDEDGTIDSGGTPD